MVKQRYLKERLNYIKRLSYYRLKGYKVPVKPGITKKPTQGSIRQIQRLNEKLNELIREQKVATGYFTKKREEQRAKTGYYLRQQAKKSKKAKKRLLRVNPRATSTLPKDKRTPKVLDNGKHVKSVVTFTDAVLRTFETEMHTAQTYISTNGTRKYQAAVREAGHNSEKYFNDEINKILAKYLPDITKKEVRQEVAKKLAEGYTQHMDELESYLYMFISDGQGNLVHDDIGIACMQSLIRTVASAEMSIEDKKRLEELKDTIQCGYGIYNDDDIDF